MADDQKAGVKHISADDFESQVLKSNKPVLVDFYADWCGPCKMAAPILDELSQEQDKVTILKLNVDENNELAQKYNVMSIPTIIAYDKGKEVNRQTGFAGKQGYQKMIDAVGE